MVKLFEFKENIFIWRYGVLEDVILSFLNLNKEIVKIFKLKCKELIFGCFKSKLKE